MTRQQVLDLYFMDARHKLIDLAAFIDRVGRSAGTEDFRMVAFRRALAELSKGTSGRAEAVLLARGETPPFENLRSLRCAPRDKRGQVDELVAGIHKIQVEH